MYRHKKAPSRLARGLIASDSTRQSLYGMMPEPVTDQARGIIIVRDDAWRAVRLSIRLGIASPSVIRISANVEAVNSSGVRRFTGPAFVKGSS